MNRRPRTALSLLGPWAPPGRGRPSFGLATPDGQIIDMGILPPELAERWEEMRRKYAKHDVFL